MTSADAGIRVERADYTRPQHAAAIVRLLDLYAQDPMGGGEPLSAFARTHLVAELARRPQAFSLLAFAGERPVGLANCIEGFSTFACQPLINVHDLAVEKVFRGKGVAHRLLSEAERIARQRGACKLTLEVLSGNTRAAALYQRCGFAPYQLDPAMGQAVFLQKLLE